MRVDARRKIAAVLTDNAELLKAIANPKHRDHTAIIEWVGANFKPDAFDSRQVVFDDPKKRWTAAFAR